MTRVKQKAPAIRFTRKELDMIQNMCCIASAATWGEGDYADETWTGKGAWTVYANLRDKIWILLEHKDVQ